VVPADVQLAWFIFWAVFRATPRGLRSKIQVALAHRVAVRIRATLILMTVGAHRHKDIVPAPTTLLSGTLTLGEIDIPRNDSTLDYVNMSDVELGAAEVEVGISERKSQIQQGIGR